MRPFRRAPRRVAHTPPFRHSPDAYGGAHLLSPEKPETIVVGPCGSNMDKRGSGRDLGFRAVASSMPAAPNRHSCLRQIMPELNSGFSLPMDVAALAAIGLNTLR